MEWNIKKLIIVSVLAVVFVAANQTNAAIVSVSGPPSSAGVLPVIIPAPANILNSVVSNLGMEGFNEAQDVMTTVAHGIDSGGPIPAGTLVDSHMIFLNKPDDIGGGLSHIRVVWTFDGPVIGVMSDGGGFLEAASTFELGAPGTNYTVGPAGQVAPYPARGMEGGDSYTVAGNQITVNMGVSQPGDWIRVITLSPIPVDVDIKPTSCPNPLNVNSKGVLPVAILGTAELDVTTIDIASIRLDGVAPIRSSYEDVAAPVSDDAEDCECTTAGPDGYLDLTLKFKKEEIIAALGEVNDGDLLELTLKGVLSDVFGGLPIEGSDCVIIIKKDKNEE